MSRSAASWTALPKPRQHSAAPARLGGSPGRSEGRSLVVSQSQLIPDDAGWDILAGSEVRLYRIITFKILVIAVWAGYQYLHDHARARGPWRNLRRNGAV